MYEPECCGGFWDYFSDDVGHPWPISHRRKHTVDRCGTDGEYVLANGDVEFEMAVSFECRHKDGQ